MGWLTILLIATGSYLEESGVPMPVPSEVSIGYLGHHVDGRPWAMAAAWVGLTTIVVLSSTNPFAASRRWGPRLVAGRIGVVLRLTPNNLRTAQRWFQRWGWLAIAASRFVPGSRWAMAIACGTMGVGYRTFWLSTAAAASIWVGALLGLGMAFGDQAAQLVQAHAWVLLALPLPAFGVLLSAVARARGVPAAKAGRREFTGPKAG